MNYLHLIRHQWLAGLLYFVAATAAIALTRFEGGVAQLWGASAILIAALACTKRQHWWAPTLACVVPTMMATGWWGLGWYAAPWFAVINGAEALITALLLSRLAGNGTAIGSMRWVGGFVASAVAAPLFCLPLVGAVLWWLGKDPVHAMLHFWSGHSLGNLAFVPMALLLTGKRARSRTIAAVRERKADAWIVVAMSVTVSLVVFGQTFAPLLFLCSLAAVIAAFRMGREGAGLFIAVLAIIGSVLSTIGYGPIQLMNLNASNQALVFQLFLASTVLTVLPIAADLHQRKTLLQRVRSSEAKFRLFSDHSSDVILHLGLQGEMRFVSPAATKLSGHDPDRLIGRNSTEFVHPEEHDLVRAEQRACLAHPGVTRRYRHRTPGADGSWRWVEANACAIVDEDGRLDGVVSLLRDITEAKAEQDSWRSAALTDRLTGLPNRRALEKAIGSDTSGRHCLALLDLDQFKSVNDTYGHDTGDEVLKGFARVARRLVRTNDMVARLGGEEFVILFEHTSLEEAYEVCDRMRRMLGETRLATSAGLLRVTTSGGVAVIGPGGFQVALKAADEALYRAKRGGRDRLLLAA